MDESTGPILGGVAVGGYDGWLISRAWRCLHVTSVEYQRQFFSTRLWRLEGIMCYERVGPDDSMSNVDPGVIGFVVGRLSGSEPKYLSVLISTVRYPFVPGQL